MHCRRQHVQENVKAPFNDHDFKLKYRIKRLVDKNWVQHKPHSIPFCLLGIIFCIQIKYEVSLRSSKKSAKVMFIHSFQRYEQQKLVFTFEWSKIFLGAALGPPPLLKTFSKCIITHWNAGKINANSAFNPINVDLFYYPKLFHTSFSPTGFFGHMLFKYLPLSKQNNIKLKNATENIQLMQNA